MILKVWHVVYLLILPIIFLKVIFPYSVGAQTLTPSPVPSNNASSEKINNLQEEIKNLQEKISETQKQVKSLSSQISVMDNQTKLTQLRINATENELKALTEDIDTTSKKISNLETTLNNLTKVLINRVVATYKTGNAQPLEIIFSSQGMTEFFTHLSYLSVVQAHDKELLYETQQAKIDYANQKEIFEGKKKKVEALKTQLIAYTNQIKQEEQSKKTLLAETQGSEESYQRLLAQAKAQLVAFSNFVSSQGGASLLSGQTQCDDWGCYYNQRDSQWGGNSLNGTGYTLASDGCLVTSMAMVYTHYGHRGVTPQTINSIPSNFASYFPAYLSFSISADGADSKRSYADIDSILASGNPVIVGISYDGGSLPDHFVVFVSGSKGNYIMNDPFTPNGHNISFRDRYPSVKIVETDRVSM